MLSEQSNKFYQHVVVHGLPYDRGFSHGQQAKEKILKNVAHYKRPGSLLPWPISLRVIRECYIPGLKKYYKTGLEEMKGIANGAGVDLEDIVLLNSRYDLSHISIPSTTNNGTNGKHHPLLDEAPLECTSAIIFSEATSDEAVYTAQNWDMSSRLLEEDGIIYLEVHPDPSENVASMFLITEAGQLCRSGLNSAGLGLTANSLQSSKDVVPYILGSGVSSKADIPAVPPSAALRRLFLESVSYAEGLKRVARTPRHVSCNLMLSTADNIGICLEITPKKIFRISGSSGADTPYILHSNHFQTESFLSQSKIEDTLAGGSSWYRADRLEVGLKRKALAGSLTDVDLITAPVPIPGQLAQWLA
ncbi:hypothetical protein BBP40_012769 [Aspergillus hancockii]|nr:hypothetical protein BBP40_012769 [Aspergillus hancockii]